MAITQLSTVEDFTAWCDARLGVYHRNLCSSEDKILAARRATHTPDVDSEKRVIPERAQWYARTLGIGHGIPARVREIDGPPVPTQHW